MRTTILITMLLIGAALSCAETRHELALTLGRVAANDRGAVKAGTGTALQANYVSGEGVVIDLSNKNAVDEITVDDRSFFD